MFDLLIIPGENMILSSLGQRYKGHFNVTNCVKQFTLTVLKLLMIKPSQLTM